MKVYNTLARGKEEFVPLTPGRVRMYVCGVTVYDLSHIGHARSAIVFDVIRRYFAFRGYHVDFVKNFTDVDDKIIKRANEEGAPAADVSERYIAEYRADMKSLGVLPPDEEPKATGHLPEMVLLIERLIAGGFAYVVDGDVYFAVRRFPAYGRLSGKNLDELLAGARVEVNERKRDPRDFVLWKAAKPGEPSWESPWGRGRPGWHIECSAMSMKYLGQSFDIHGGGEDLIFPHHECEIAQSEAVTGQPLARYWIHNGFVNLGAEKMSKSLGNVLTIRELVKRHDPDAIRLWLLGTHYRHPVEFSEERIAEASRALDRLRGVLVEARRLASGGPDGCDPDLAPGRLDAKLAAIADRELVRELEPATKRFIAEMDDDFNTPGALAAMFDASRALYRYRGSIDRGRGEVDLFLPAVDVLATMGRALGLFTLRRAEEGPSADVRAVVERLVNEREDARKQRDWSRADEIRHAIKAHGATVEDTPAGPRIKWGSS